MDCDVVNHDATTVLAIVLSASMTFTFEDHKIFKNSGLKSLKIKD